MSDPDPCYDLFYMDREDHLKYGGHAAGNGCSETYKDRQGEPGIIIRKTNMNKSVKENIRGNIAKNDVLIDERNTKRS